MDALADVQRGVTLSRLLLTAFIIISIAAAVGYSGSESAEAQTTGLQLTVRNTTLRQPITAPIVVIHSRTAVLVPSSSERVHGMEEMAEGGEQMPLMDTLENRNGVKSVLRYGGLIGPGTAATIQNIPAEPGDRITVIGMLACTNDAMVVGTVIYSESGALPALGSASALDAGTEENTETTDTVPCLGGEGISDADTADGEGRINVHPGIRGDADLAENYGWDEPAMLIALAQRGSRPRRQIDLGVTVENLTAGQPLTPPLVVVHDREVDPFEFKRPAELNGIDDLSEGGVRDALANTLIREPGVLGVHSIVTGAPILPGKSFTADISALPGSAITVLAMFACTNDAYIQATAPFSARVDVVTTASAIASVLDSGAENNDETTGTVPCLGGEPAALSDGPGENQLAMHEGIMGVGDLDPVVHGWTDDATVKISLHRAGNASEVVVLPTPVPTEPVEELPDSGGAAPSGAFVWLIGVLGVMAIAAGLGMLAARRFNQRGI